MLGKMIELWAPKWILKKSWLVQQTVPKDNQSLWRWNCLKHVTYIHFLRIYKELRPNNKLVTRGSDGERWCIMKDKSIKFIHYSNWFWLIYWKSDIVKICLLVTVTSASENTSADDGFNIIGYILQLSAKYL